MDYVPLLSSEECDPVDVVLSNFSIHIAKNNMPCASNKNKIKQTKVLLQPLSVRVKGGSLFAILGSSGSGKTTLLNVISQRYDKNSTIIFGDISYETPNRKYEYCKVGYVTQSDLLLPYLTVKETIHFAAKLKVPQCSSIDSSLDTLVDNLIAQLGLSECKNTRIGDNANSSNLAIRRGISGGEKRRVSVALQVVSNPQCKYHYCNYKCHSLILLLGQCFVPMNQRPD